MLKLERNQRPGCLSRPAVITKRHSRVWSLILLGPRGLPGVLRGRRWASPPILPFWGMCACGCAGHSQKRQAGVLGLGRLC